MLTSIDGSQVEGYVRDAGVVLLDWRHPKNAASLLFDQVLDRVSGAHNDVRFGAVDLSKEPRAAREWEVGEAPTLTAFRDGILVFRHWGPLPPAALEDLIQAIWSLDMDEVRKGMDGGGSRIFIVLRDEEEPSFEIAAQESASKKSH